MNPELVIYGAGGHGKVIAEILLASGRTVHGFIDDDFARVNCKVLGLPVLAAQEWLRHRAPAEVALGIGDNRAREQAAARIKHCGCTLVSAAHPTAVIARSAKLGEGVAIMAAAVLNADCEVGEGAIINTAAVVEHDVRVGRYAHISPKCGIGGGADIGAFSQIGMGANILPMRKVGMNCIVGAGAVVLDDIADGQTASGVPARLHLPKL